MDVKAGGPEFDHAPTVTHEFPPSPPPHNLTNSKATDDSTTTLALRISQITLFFCRKPI